MANDFAAVIPKLLAQGMLALRQLAIMPLLVTRQYDAIAGEQGSTIDIPLPPTVSVADVTPGTTSGSTADITPTKVQVALDKWKVAKFAMTDKDALEVMNGTIPLCASDALKNLANQVDTDILACYKDIYGYTGTAGTTPFNATTKTGDATNARVILNQQLAPINDRRIVLDPVAEGNALQLQNFQDASWAGTPLTIMQGQVGTKLGFNWAMDQNIPTHTAGTASAATITTAVANAAAATSVTLKTASGTATVVVGDIISFAGHTQTYTVTAAATLTTSGVAVTISPALKVAVDGSGTPVAVTVRASHVVNLAFQRDCIAFVNRALPRIPSEFGVQSSSVIDPVSGIALRLQVVREYMRVLYMWDILYGVKCIRPELGCRIAG